MAQLISKFSVFYFTKGTFSGIDLVSPRKFYRRSNNNKVDSIETGCIVIADLLPWSDLEKNMHITLF